MKMLFPLQALCKKAKYSGPLVHIPGGQPSKTDEWWTIEMQKYNLWPSGITKGKSITAANPTDIFVWAEVVDQLPDQRNPA